MRHGIKKVRFGQGKDATKMLLRKLATNFILCGRLTTTMSRAKSVRWFVESLVSKAKNQSTADLCQLTKALNNQTVVKRLTEIVSVFKEVNGGYTRIVRLNERNSDGALMAELQWSRPVVLKEAKPYSKDSRLKVKNIQPPQKRS